MNDEFLQTIISENAKSMKRSAIRDLLKMATRPEIISFGGGFPDITSFPVEELREVVNEVLDENALQALQYGETLGVKKLREVLAQRYKDQGIHVTYRTSSSPHLLSKPKTWLRSCLSTQVTRWYVVCLLI